MVFFRQFYKFKVTIICNYGKSYNLSKFEHKYNFVNFEDKK